MELVLIILFVTLCFGGFQWCFQRFFQARDFTRGFLAEHPVAYRLAGCLAFFSGAGIALALSLEMPNDPVVGFVVIGFIVAIIALPLWFVIALVAGLFCRNFIAPTLEVAGYVLWPLRAIIGVIAKPVRRTADTVRDEQSRAEQEHHARGKKHDQKRRENARARCEVTYHLHAPEIGKRFTRPMFDDYMRKYMGDGRDPDEVEERAAQLEALLQEHVERVRPAPKFRSLEDIARWFEEQKRQLAGLPDDRVRQTLLAKLKARYTELTTAFLEEMQA